MTKISKRSVDALKAESNLPAYLWDEQLHGFGVKALPSGLKRYIVKYRTHGGGRAAPQRWLTLGTHGHITPDQARASAQQVLAAVARGEDPQGIKFGLRVAPTLQVVWERFRDEHLPQKKPGSRKEYEAQWTQLICPKFGQTKVESISRGEVDRFHKGLRDTPYRANRTLALFARLMSLAEAWDMRAQGTNPCRYVERFPEQARTRFLSVVELRQIGIALEILTREKGVSQTAANAIELLLLTGARLNEVLSAKWDWVDQTRGILNLPDSKTGAKPVYLSDEATSLLTRQKSQCVESPFIFPSQSQTGHYINLRKAWVKVCERASLEGVRLHDLRHTAASIAAGSGASLPIIGRLLGHSQAQTTLRYAHVDTDPALKAANGIGRVIGAAFRPPAPAVEVKPKIKRRKVNDEIILITG